jgi:hypothetical protein
MGTLFEGPAALVVGLLLLILIGVVAGVVWGLMRKRPTPRVKGPDGAKVALPAGWYPDPGGEGQRYWTGAAWTEQRRP